MKKSEEIQAMTWKELLEDENTTVEIEFNTPALAYGWYESDGSRMVVMVDDLPEIFNQLGWDDLLDGEYDLIIRPYVEELKAFIIDEMTYSESFEE